MSRGTVSGPRFEVVDAMLVLPIASGLAGYVYLLLTSRRMSDSDDSGIGWRNPLTEVQAHLEDREPTDDDFVDGY